MSPTKQRQPTYPFPSKSLDTNTSTVVSLEQPEEVYGSSAASRTAPANVKLSQWERANSRARLRRKPEQTRK
jgi:hypothetical protein